MLDDQVLEMVAPGSEGELGVLAGHMPLMTTLKPGEISVTMPDNRTTSHILVGGGLLEVSREGAVVLADSAERVDEIDVTRAENDLTKQTACWRSYRQDRRRRVKPLPPQSLRKRG